MVAILLAVCLFYTADAVLDKKIEDYRQTDYERYFNGRTSTIRAGQIALCKGSGYDGLFLMGSSELGSTVDQNPANMFPNAELPVNTSIIGHAYVQSLLHSMELSALDINTHDKVAIVISLQWFYGDDVDPSGFASNFSKRQFYETISDTHLSETDRRYICSRVYSLLSSMDGFDDIKLYTYFYKHDNLFSRVCRVILTPYYNADAALLRLQDKIEAYRILKGDGVETANSKLINWNEEKEKAEIQGKKNCTNNSFYVENGYYDTYLRAQIELLKDSSKSEKLESKEYDDYKMFLHMCKLRGIEPYVILMNTNGWYYDYIGIDRETRNKFYAKLQKTAEDYGFQALNLSDKEYEPYFMYDVMHLGWKGWLYVNQRITEHFSEK